MQEGESLDPWPGSWKCFNNGEKLHTKTVSLVTYTDPSGWYVKSGSCVPLILLNNLIVHCAGEQVAL